jgi:hypothetical protein
MQLSTYATVLSHALTVEGHPHSGWTCAAPLTADSQQLEFTFSVQDDGGGNFLLVYSSLDGRFAADTWHETLADAFACAESEFGVKSTEWVTVSDKDSESKRGNNVV